MSTGWLTGKLRVVLIFFYTHLFFYIVCNQYTLKKIKKKKKTPIVSVLEEVAFN